MAATTEAAVAAALHPEVVSRTDALIATRRGLHQQPELGFECHDTAAYILQRLRDIGGWDEIHTGIATTGIIALLKGGNGDGPCILLRADMDGLPVQEVSDREYKSQRDNVMHACGHDGHMAILLTVAEIIAQPSFRSRLKGSIKLCFQPAEEGGGGGRVMTDPEHDEHVLVNPHVDAVYALHLWNYMKPLTVGIKPGPVMANSDRFYIDIVGIGGHGAVPQGTTDAVAIGAQLVSALHHIVSRNVDPLHSAVLTVGTFNAGYGPNIIADKARITGTVRSYDRGIGDVVKDRILETAKGLALSHGGCSINVDYRYGYPATVNTTAETERVREAALRVLPASGVIGDPPMFLTGEDFSYFLQKRPGCFFFVGSSPHSDPASTIPHHNPAFDIDERCLAVGASVMVKLVEDLLMSGQ